MYEFLKGGCTTAWVVTAGAMVFAAHLAAEPLDRTVPAGAQSLAQVFELAWARQPESHSYIARKDSADARRRIADEWTASPPSLEVSGKSDQLSRNGGSREYAAGLALPLWLPGERVRAGAVADAEARALESRVSAAKLRTAALVRDAWWRWQRQLGERVLAEARWASAKRLAQDVAARVRAGDLALADRHQADGAVASAEVALAEAEAGLAASAQQLKILSGRLPRPDASDAPEKRPEVPGDPEAFGATHPAVAEWGDRAEAARRLADLARVQTRNNPELLLATTRDRSTFAEPWQQTMTLGVRVPFGSDNRSRAKTGQANAEAIEAETQLRLERERVLADLEARQVRVAASMTQAEAAQRRAILARESRGFFEKSFRLGETDLPTRLRIELEAVDAERQAARARIEYAAAVSDLRQALGLLPE